MQGDRITEGEARRRAQWSLHAGRKLRAIVRDLIGVEGRLDVAYNPLSGEVSCAVQDICDLLDWLEWTAPPRDRPILD